MTPAVHELELREPNDQFAGQRWSIGIFSSREALDRLLSTIAAACRSDTGGAELIIDVLVNGNRRLAQEVQRYLEKARQNTVGASVRIWSMPLPDKAYTWNLYVHELIPNADISFFIDGYVRLDRSALRLMASALTRRQDKLAASCVPSVGRSAAALRRQLLEEGGLHGNFFALTNGTIGKLRSIGMRLPAGIYRNDAALGAALAFNFDPKVYSWDLGRIVVVPEALYETPVLHVLRPSDLRTAIRRLIRQARGRLENRAIKAHLAVERRPPSGWPESVAELILQWAQMHPNEARALLWQDPLAWLELKHLRSQPPMSLVSGGWECIGHSSCVTPIDS